MNWRQKYMFLFFSLMLLPIGFVANKTYASELPFSEYPATVYSGKTKLPEFGGAQRSYRSYRTRIREGMKEGPNFAGSYSIIQIGCGASCSYVLVGNNRTGEVFEFPRGPRSDNFGIELRHEIGSRLIVVQWSNTAICVRENFLLEENDSLRLIKSNEMPTDGMFCKEYLNP